MPRTACAGELHRAEPPLHVAAPLRAQPCPTNTLGGLPVPRCTSPAQGRAKWTPRAPILVNSGEVRRAPPWSKELRRASPQPARGERLGPFDLRSTVHIRSSIPLRPAPFDQDPTAQNRRYRFAHEVLLKSPWTFRNQPAVQPSS